MRLDVYSYKRQQIRRKTRRAFLLSVVLHAIAIAIMGLGYIRWYRPQVPTEPLVSEAIAVTNLQRFHVSSLQKRTMPTRRSTPLKTSPTVNRSVAKLAPTTPTAANASIPVLQTVARLPAPLFPPENEGIKGGSARTDNRNASVENDCGSARTQTPTIAPKPKTRRGENTKHETGDTKTPAPPIDRDGEMGEALEGIAESVADNDTDTTVDIVFLLDISGTHDR